VDSAPTALALVALAGVVAVLATKGIVRRVVGALVAVAGAAIIWRSAQACAAVSAARAHDLVRDKHPRVSGSAVLAQQVSTHLVWGLLSIAGGVLVLVAGVWIAWRGGHWGAMSARYDAPVAGSARPGPDDAERAQSRADAALWTALEHGEDPTADDPGRSR
jgi:uncharacterized membrane protein (TIGR02234 family)